MPNDHPQLMRLLAQASRTNRPIRVMLEITHRCHLACTHCYLEDNHSWDRRGQELTTEEICSTIEQLHAEGCLFLSITGGEIFLRPDLLTIVRRAREAGLVVTLLTSGTLISDRIVAELAELHPWRVELSLYSNDPQLHDDITQKPGSHARTMGALHKLRGAGIPVLIKCPLMRQNFDSYPALRALADELEIPFIADTTVTPRNDGDPEPTHSRLTSEQLVQFFSRPEIRQFAQVERRVPQPDEPICSIGHRSCLIGPFGDIYACMAFRTPVGNLRQSSFADIWHRAPLLEQLRAIAARNLGPCSGCNKFTYCNRCAGTALAEHRDFLGPSEWSCQIAAAKEQAARLTNESSPDPVVASVEGEKAAQR